LPVPPGAVSIVVKHRIPERQYFFAVTREWVPIAPLTLPQGIRIAAGAAASLSSDCKALVSGFEMIGNPGDETEVPAKAKAIDDLRSSDLYQKCTDAAVRKPIDDALVVLTSTEIIGPVTLSSGEQLRVTVQRIGTNASVEKTWTIILTTGARGEWLTTFGLTFVPDDNERFFSAPATEANKFVITRERDPGDSELTFLPTVMFSWLATRQRGNYLVFSPTAGVGATTNTFAALLGGTATFNLNLGVTAGIAFVNQKRLLGKYTEGQVVSENLTEEQLHRNAMLPKFFFSITLRFGQSPFGSPPAAPPPPPPPITGETGSAGGTRGAAGGAGAGTGPGAKPPADSPKGEAPPVGEKPAPGAVKPENPGTK
jgi:hypothetical protein